MKQIKIFIAGVAMVVGVIYLVRSDYFEDEFGLDCVQFSNGVLLGAPPEYRVIPPRNDGMNYNQVMRFSVEFPSFKPKQYPPKEELLANPNAPRLSLLQFSIEMTRPDYLERMIGPGADSQYTAFNVPDGEIYGLKRYQYPASNDFRNYEIYQYISPTDISDSVIIRCDKRPINVEGARAVCNLIKEYQNDIRIVSIFNKGWLDKWREIAKGTEEFLNDKLINDWGKQCQMLIQK